jgi:hypothetical protein
MHRKYGKDGLACLSVSVDDVKDRDTALVFLKRQGAVFPNYLLDEEGDFWQDKWQLSGPPAVFVFDRHNQRAAKFAGDDADKHDKVEKLVLELLKDRE